MKQTSRNSCLTLSTDYAGGDWIYSESFYANVFNQMSELRVGAISSLSAPVYLQVLLAKSDDPAEIAKAARSGNLEWEAAPGRPFNISAHDSHNSTGNMMQCKDGNLSRWRNGPTDFQAAVRTFPCGGCTVSRVADEASLSRRASYGQEVHASI
ncbi:MAG: hypothetical protein PHV74_09605 [Dehalococcoidia bacterium]|nr:hypothetical protein [Dehalococcoidia bacterium]